MAYLNPLDIKFRQSSINDTFTNGMELTEVFRDLVTGELEVDEIEPITCVEWNHEYWVIHGSRRLFLFQKLEKARMVDEILVNVKPFIPDLFFNSYTTTNDGASVKCHNNPDLRHELNDILRENGREIESDTSESEDEF